MSKAWAIIVVVILSILSVCSQAEAQAGTTHLVFTTLPSTDNLDQPFTVAVTAENGLGGVVTGFGFPITITIGTNPNSLGVLGYGTLPLPGITTTSATVTPSSGVATFSNLYLTAAGDYTFVASATSVSNATSSTFDVVSSTGIFAAYPPTTGADYTTFTDSVAPYINGVILPLKWADVDTAAVGSTVGCSEATTCNWTDIDNTLNQFIDLGLEVGLLVWPATDSSSNSATPAYIFTTAYAGAGYNPQDVIACSSYAGDTGDTGSEYTLWSANDCSTTIGGGCSLSTVGGSADISGLPIPFERPFKLAYSHFIEQVLQHYSSTGSGYGSSIYTHLAYIRFGSVNGGEAFPFCNSYWPPPAGWPHTTMPTEGANFTFGNFVGTYGSTGYTAQLDNAIAGDSPSVPIVMSTLDPVNFTTDPIHEFADGEAILAEDNVLGFGMESLSTNDPDVTLLDQDFDEGLTCQEDWCANFDTYATSGPPLYLQVTKPSAQTIFSLIGSGSSIDGCNGTTCTAICTTTTSNYCNFLTNASAIGYVSIVSTSNSAFNFPPYSFNYDSLNGSVFAQTGFTFDSTYLSSETATGGYVYAPDFIPLTYPFGIENFATSLESNMCDLYWAFAPTSAANCVTGPASGLGSTANYLATFESITGLYPAPRRKALRHGQLGR